MNLIACPCISVCRGTDRRIGLFLLLILTLCLLPACSSPTVTYFPVRQEPGISLLLLNHGKLVHEDGLLRFNEISSNKSYLLIWPDGYTYRISGSRIEVLDDEGEVIAKSGQYLIIGGGPASSVEQYTKEPPPIPLPGPYWAIGGGIKNLYPWDYGAGPYIIALTAAVLVIATLIVWLIMRRRSPDVTP